MGCDIHVRTEMLNENGEWTSLDKYVVHEDWDDTKNPSYPFFVDDIYDGRDYELFGLLAGVRDCYSKPISEPRGIPDSANHFIRDEWDNDCANWCHTPSWLTLGEMRKCWCKHIDDSVDEDDEPSVYARLLSGIINPLEKMICDKKYFYYENDAEMEEKCRKYWDAARIVFWFDS